VQRLGNNLKRGFRVNKSLGPGCKNRKTQSLTAITRHLGLSENCIGMIVMSREVKFESWRFGEFGEFGGLREKHSLCSTSPGKS